MTHTLFEIDTERVIAFRPELAKALGSIEGAIYFQQLLYWWKHRKDKEWIYKTIEEIEQETTLSKKVQKRVRDTLIAKKYIEVEFKKDAKGTPKLHFKVLVNLVLSGKPFTPHQIDSDQRELSTVTKGNTPIYKEIQEITYTRKPSSPLRDRCVRFIDWFNSRLNTNYIPTDARATKLATRLKRFTPEQLTMAVENALNDPFFNGSKTGFKLTPDFVLRSDENVDKLLNLSRGKRGYDGVRISL